MKLKTLSSLAVAALALLAQPSFGGTVILTNHVTNISTGQATPEGFIDPLWSITSAPGGSGMNTSGAAYVETNPAFWATPAAGTHYISSGNCDASLSADCPGGTYSFTLDFNLASTDGVSLNFQTAGDNRVEVYLNNLFLYAQGAINDDSNHTGFNALSALQTVTSGFLVGNNTLELRVRNTSSYTGGVLTGEIVTPEPATMLISGVGLVGFGLLRRRRVKAN